MRSPRSLGPLSSACRGLSPSLPQPNRRRPTASDVSSLILPARSTCSRCQTGDPHSVPSQTGVRLVDVLVPSTLPQRDAWQEEKHCNQAATSLQIGTSQRIGVKNELVAAVGSTETPAPQPRERAVPDQRLQLPASKLAPVQGMPKPCPEPHQTPRVARQQRPPRPSSTPSESLRVEDDSQMLPPRFAAPPPLSLGAR